MEEYHKEFLKSNCNRLKYGKCQTLRCLRRGGYISGKPDFNKSTCEAYEIYQILKNEDIVIFPKLSEEEVHKIEKIWEDRYTHKEMSRIKSLSLLLLWILIVIVIIAYFHAN